MTKQASDNVGGVTVVYCQVLVAASRIGSPTDRTNPVLLGEQFVVCLVGHPVQLELVALPYLFWIRPVVFSLPGVVTGLAQEVAVAPV